MYFALPPQFATMNSYSVGPLQHQAPQPAFAGKYSDRAILAVMRRRYEVPQSYFRCGSQYSFTGLEILERLDEACNERPKRRNGATTLERIAAHPFIERDELSMRVLEEGLQDLCAIGFARQLRAGEYLITPEGQSYLYPPEDDVFERLEPSEQDEELQPPLD